MWDVVNKWINELEDIETFLFFKYSCRLVLNKVKKKKKRQTKPLNYRIKVSVVFFSITLFLILHQQQKNTEIRSSIIMLLFRILQIKKSINGFRNNVQCRHSWWWEINWWEKYQRDFIYICLYPPKWLLVGSTAR